MKGDIQEQVKIAETEVGRWLVGVFEDEHFLDAQPTVETVRALIDEAERHHDALERLVDR